MVLSVLIFITATVPASKIRVILIVEIIASSIGMILAIMISSLHPRHHLSSLKLIVMNYYLSIGLLILRVILILIH